LCTSVCFKVWEWESGKMKYLIAWL
jgi:hypothetical protein